MIHTDIDERNDRRSSRSLNGRWEFTTDDADAGENDEWYRPDSEWSETQRVTVPHAWQELDEYRDYVGTAWYRRSFELEDPSSDDGAGTDRYVLRFGAVDYEATVWLNGVRLGTHRDGYLPFEFDATDAVERGTNALVVRVHDPEDITEIPHGKQGEPWYTRVSGIWQDVELETRPATHVESIRVEPNLDDDTATIDVSATTDGSADSEDVAYEVTVEREGAEVAHASGTLDVDGSGSVTATLEKPVYWTPDDPALYDVCATLKVDGAVVDERWDYFGMRSVSVEDGRIHLNGEPLYVRGALDQAYYPDTLYRPFDDDLFEHEIRTAKELGFNLLRKHIKPAHPDFLELADRLGILVWEEPANPSVYTERSREEVREQIRGLIERDFNRPSVVIWSLYNEEWGIGYDDEEEPLWTDSEKQEYLTSLYYEAKEWDPTRLVCDNSGWAHVATDLNDYHRYFVSPDRRGAWSDDLDHIVSHPEDNYGATETDPADAPIVVSEFGTWGLCDVPAIEEHYGGEPAWFSHSFLDDPLKRPEGVRDRFEGTDLAVAFGDFDSLAETWHEREFRSVEDVIGQMRSREGIAGYVITEFSDIEWEFNGILDYFREEKSFHEEFGRINGEVAIRLEPTRHAVWSGETVEVDLVVFNDTNERLEGTVSATGFDTEETTRIEAEPFDTARIDGAFRFEPTADENPIMDDLVAELETETATANAAEPIIVVSGHGNEPTIGTVYADSEQLVDRLAEFGFDVVDSPDDADVAVTASLTDRLESFARAGGSVVLVPDESGHMASTDGVELRELPETESWNLVASLFYHDSELLSELASGRSLGWGFEDLYPYEVVTDLGDERSIEVGYVEGWLANHSSPLLERDLGDGSLWVCTFRITEQYGEHPVGTELLNTVLERTIRENDS